MLDYLGEAGFYPQFGARPLSACSSGQVSKDAVVELETGSPVGVVPAGLPVQSYGCKSFFFSLSRIFFGNGWPAR
ncbi:hypothetical protein [Hymenobacter lapidiphilus]|uniref:hypothetical protein n=1 Tax=Hymenobacter sp. CCM 8763 TaxID=2303334 RepID=UPI00167EF263